MLRAENVGPPEVTAGPALQPAAGVGARPGSGGPDTSRRRAVSEEQNTPARRRVHKRAVLGHTHAHRHAGRARLSARRMRALVLEPSSRPAVRRQPARSQHTFPWCAIVRVVGTRPVRTWARVLPRETHLSSGLRYGSWQPLPCRPRKINSPFPRNLCSRLESGCFLTRSVQSGGDADCAASGRPGTNRDRPVPHRFIPRWQVDLAVSASVRQVKHSFPRMCVCRSQKHRRKRVRKNILLRGCDSWRL